MKKIRTDAEKRKLQGTWTFWSFIGLIAATTLLYFYWPHIMQLEKKWQGVVLMAWVNILFIFIVAGLGYLSWVFHDLARKKLAELRKEKSAG